MAEKLRVGLVGASAEGGSWGARAHVPAIHSLPDVELAAICTAHEETARASAAAFGAGHAYHDYNAMFADPDIDLVSVAVRVPKHYEITMAALAAGKNVYCEWPLGANVAEAESMAGLARERGLRTMVGLQARSDPTLMHARQLIADGFIGDVVTCHMTVLSPGALERNTARLWQGDAANGANTFTITGGHNIDALCFLLGEFAEVTGKVVTQVPQVKVTDTGEMAPVTAPDNAVVAGVLAGGALASIHVASVPYHGSGGWHLAIYGREGTLVLAAGQANYNPAPISLLGAKGREPLAELPVPAEYVLVPEGTPAGPPSNVAQAYTRYADALRAGEPIEPSFELALRRHRLLAAMEQSSREGRAVSLS